MHPEYLLVAISDYVLDGHCGDHTLAENLRTVANVHSREVVEAAFAYSAICMKGRWFDDEAHQARFKEFRGLCGVGELAAPSS